MKKYLTLFLLAVVLVLGSTSLANAAPSLANTQAVAALQQAIAKIEEVLRGLKEDLASRLVSSSKSSMAAVFAGVTAGGRVQTNTAATVYSRGNSLGKVIGSQPLYALGTVAQGPVSETKYVYLPAGCNTLQAATACTRTLVTTRWMLVDFDRGVNGWVKDTQLSSAVSTKYVEGTEFIANTLTNVRSAPNGTILGTQQRGADGVIAGNPVSAGGYVWWPTNYDRGVDGWTAEPNLTNPGVLLPDPPTFYQVRTSMTPELASTTAGLLDVDIGIVSQLVNGLALQGVTPTSDNDGIAMTTIPGGTMVVTEAGKTIIPPGYQMAFGQNSNGDIKVTAVDSNGASMTMTAQVTEDGRVIVTMTGKDGQQGQLFIVPKDDGSADVFVVIQTPEGQETQVIKIKNTDEPMPPPLKEEVVKDESVVPLEVIRESNIDSPVFGKILEGDLDLTVIDGFGSAHIPSACADASCVTGGYDWSLASFDDFLGDVDYTGGWGEGEGGGIFELDTLEN